MILPQTKPGAHVGILGGSFDPPHLGHQMLALCALALEKIDQLWIIPCADHPFSKQLSPFHHRFEMCKLAFGHLGENVRVLDVENTLAAPNYTVKTIEAIHQARPNATLSFIMGSDVYMDLPRWHHPEKIAQLCRLVVFLREGSALHENTVPFNAYIHREFSLPHVQSTLIREKIRLNVSHSAFVDHRVLDYLQHNKLY